MKCWRCGKDVPDGSSTCVYCGAGLVRTQTVTPEGRALRHLYDLYGADRVLTNSAYLVSGVGDLLEHSKHLRNQLKMAADAGVLRLYQEQLSVGAPDPSFDARVRVLLTEEAGLSDKAASDIAGYLDEMIGWSRPKKEASSAGTGPKRSAGPKKTQWDSTGPARPFETNRDSSGEAPAPQQPPRKERNTGLVRLTAIVAGLAAALYLLLKLFSPGGSAASSVSSSGSSSAGSSSESASTSDSGETPSEAIRTPGSSQEKGPYKLTVSGGTILLVDGDVRTDMGTSCELEKGQTFILMPDPDDGGYSFKEWTVTDASGEALLLRKMSGMYQDENGKYYSHNIMPAQAVNVEAVLEPWVLIDWVPVLDLMDRYFTYGGKYLADMEKSDWTAFFNKKGITCYTEENGKQMVANYVKWYVADTAKGGSCYRACELPNALNCSMEMSYDSDALLPGSCPVRMGDTYIQVCTKLGASQAMAEALRTQEEAAKASRTALKNYYQASDYRLYTGLELKQDGREVLSLDSRDYRYQFWFNEDGTLYRIAVFDKAE